jgi:hypothetical protein
MHRDEGHPVNDVHQALVGECVARLQKMRLSAIATRGAHLLSVLLAEVEQMPRSASSASRKRRRSASTASATSRLKLLKIRKLAGKPGGRHEFSAPGNNVLETQEGFFCTSSDGQVVEELEAADVRVPEMLPPQAGFSNDFLFNELLDLWL